MKIEKLLEILKGTEEVIFRINGVGEETYSTKEIHECIAPLIEKQIDHKYKEAFKFAADFAAGETHKRKYPHETVKKLSGSLMLLNGYFKGEEVQE